MNLLLTIVIIIAIVLAITGSMVQSVQFLLWVGIAIAVVAVIAFLLRTVSGRRV